MVSHLPWCLAMLVGLTLLLCVPALHFAVNRASHGLVSGEVEALDTLRTILDLGYERLLCFPLWYKQ
jgi:hypothetical protein